MKKNIVLLAVAALVLALAPAAQADLITGVTATASSEFSAARSAITAVNGDGMTGGELATGMHQSTSYDGGWSAGEVPLPQWFRVDLGDTYDVGTMYVWNGQNGPGVETRGIRLADIYYSTVDTADPIPTGSASSGDWTLLTDEQAFASKPANTLDYGFTDDIALGITARVIGFDITALQTQNPNNASIAELQFDGELFVPPTNNVPEPASIAIWSFLGICLAGYGYRRRRRNS